MLEETRDVEWSRIKEGEPESGGYRVYGIGLVGITEKDEQQASEMGGDPRVTLIDVTAASERTPYWRIHRMVARDPEVVALSRRKRLRQRVLCHYYNANNDKPGSSVDPELIAKEENVTREQAEDIYTVTFVQRDF